MLLRALEAGKEHGPILGAPPPLVLNGGKGRLDLLGSIGELVCCGGCEGRGR